MFRDNSYNNLKNSATHFHSWDSVMLLYSSQEKAAVKQVFIISEDILQEEKHAF